MKQYKVFEHPMGKVEAVKQGWSWPGFFFNIIWALIKRMWALGASLLAIFIVISIIASGYGGETEKVITAMAYLGNFIIAIVFGINGNRWREKNLLSRGFDFRNTVTAANQEGAIALYLKGNNTLG